LAVVGCEFCDQRVGTVAGLLIIEDHPSTGFDEKSNGGGANTTRSAGYEGYSPIEGKPYSVIHTPEKLPY
jgi:hypothetical protein